MYASGKKLYWFQAFENCNYPRHFSHYWDSQKMLAEQHPAMYDKFKEVGFSSQYNIGKFNKVSPDQFIEQIVNKDKKVQGI